MRHNETQPGKRGNTLCITCTIAWVVSRGPENTTVQIVDRIRTGGLGLRMNDNRQVFLPNHLEKRMHHRIVELDVEVTGKQRDREQSEFVNTALQLAFGRLGFVNR
jgi:hypothetical protein